MRKGGLELLAGGGQAPTCELCDAGLFIHGENEEADGRARKAIAAYLAGKTGPDTVTTCTAHREDLEAMGVQLGPVAALARKQRRATQAVLKRAHRSSMRTSGALKPPVPERGGGDQGGGLAF